MEITREQFLAYEDVRESGVTNMYDIRTVMDLSGLSKEVIVEIMLKYSVYAQKYLTEEEGG